MLAASPPCAPPSPPRHGRSTSLRCSLNWARWRARRPGSTRAPGRRPCTTVPSAGLSCGPPTSRGTEQVPLLTIASWEWDGGSETWIAEEDHANPGPPPLGAQYANFTLIDIIGGYALQLHVCPDSPDHPHIELMP
ncbi:hypothetical protein ACIBI8_33750 [Streptomyces sp. NPDC050529]|uniref:hypothetical protein n=1 Tax=Streptomyces sp. NPDC050529 TaxID=3365624 RepID=UPI0037A68666